MSKWEFHEYRPRHEGKTCAPAQEEKGMIKADEHRERIEKEEAKTARDAIWERAYFAALGGTAGLDICATDLTVRANCIALITVIEWDAMNAEMDAEIAKMRGEK